MSPSTDLLTASESNAFSSFLSAMDSFDPSSSSGLGLSAEWTMYHQNQLQPYSQPGGKEDLAKATKDLISIGFRDGLDVMGTQASSFGAVFQPQQHRPPLQSPTNTFMPSNLHLAALFGSQSNQNQHHPAHFQHASASWPSMPSSDAAGAFDAQYGISISPQRTRPTLASISMAFPSASSSNGRSSSSTSTSSSATPRSLATPVCTSPTSGLPSRKRTSLDLRNGGSCSNVPSDADFLANKRLRFSPTSSSSSNEVVNGTSTSPASISRKHSASSSAPSRPTHHKSASSSSRSKSGSTSSDHQNASSGSSSPPPTPSTSGARKEPHQLLSSQQKKLNHIHSEQKRRANIRKGYDSLCEVVPALRDAIAVEDKECERTGRKRGRGRLLGEDGEKLDGRAGPRSESVVLQKTIEYMTELLDARQNLLDRLAVARSSLPPGHPVLMSTGEKPWERLWDGGIGLPLGGLGENQDLDGDDGSDGEWDGDDAE